MIITLLFAETYKGVLRFYFQWVFIMKTIIFFQIKLQKGISLCIKAWNPNRRGC